jgi:Xaa-Pro aminopeptidase
MHAPASKSSKRTGRRSATARRSWPAHLARRIKAIRRKIRAAELDALLVTRPIDIRYLTGFSGHDSWLLVSARHAIVISDFRYREQLEADCPFVNAIIRSGPMSEALRVVVGDHKLHHIGFQHDHLTTAIHKTLADKIGARRLKGVGGWLNELRAVKDETELRLIRRAINIQQRAFERLRDQIEPDMTEQDLVARLEYIMRSLGGEGPAFDTIVAIGPNSSRPHAVPGRRRVRPGQPILIDFGTVTGGYHSDLTRVLFLRNIRRKIEEIYPIVLEAQQAAIAAVRPGVKLAHVDSVARKIIERAGYGPQFGHSLGHGIGLEIHEQPTLSTRSEGMLKPGHVVTVEPGIYLPGVGGIRIEDDVLVTPKGHRILSRLKRSLESAII